jgi:glycogen operon protein
LQVVAYCLHGLTQRDADIYVMINASPEGLIFELQEGDVGDWCRVIDTSLASPDDFRAPGDAATVSSNSYAVSARSIVVLVRLGTL